MPAEAAGFREEREGLLSTFGALRPDSVVAAGRRAQALTRVSPVLQLSCSKEGLPMFELVDSQPSHLINTDVLNLTPGQQHTFLLSVGAGRSKGTVLLSW